MTDGTDKVPAPDTGAETDLSDEQLFDQLLEEFPASKAPSEIHSVSVDDDEDTDGGAAADDSQDDTDEGTAGDPPATPKTGADSEDKGAKTSSEGPEQTEGSEDQLADLPPAAQKVINDLQHRLKSAEGRLRPRQHSRPPSKSTGSEEGETLKALKENLEEARREYPDIVGPLADQLDRVSKRLDALDSERESQWKEDVAQERQVFDAAHPDGLELVGKNRDAFWKWVDDQPGDIRRAALAMTNSITDGQAAIRILDGFKAHMGLEKAPATQTTDTTTAMRREAQRRGARTSRSSSPRLSPDGPPEGASDEEIFEHLARTIPNPNAKRR